MSNDTRNQENTQIEATSMSAQLQRTIAGLQIICAWLEVILRKPGTVGSRWWGMQMLLSMVGLFLTIIFCQTDQQVQLCLFVFFVACAFLLGHRARGVQDRKKGIHVHTYFNGTSWFGEDSGAKRWKEPTLALAAGIALGYFCPPLGIYTCIGAVGLAVTAEWYRQAEEKILLDMRDSMQMQGYYAGQMRREE